jgi:hypothetical protein
MAGREHGKLGFEPLIPVHWSEQGTGPHTSGRLPSHSFPEVENEFNNS